MCALPVVVTMRLLESVSLQPVTQRCTARVRKEWVWLSTKINEWFWKKVEDTVFPRIVSALE